MKLAWLVWEDKASFDRGDNPEFFLEKPEDYCFKIVPIVYAELIEQGVMR